MVCCHFLFKNKLTIKELIFPAFPSDPMPVRALTTNKNGMAYGIFPHLHEVFPWYISLYPMNLTNNEISE